MLNKIEDALKLISPSYRMGRLYRGFSPDGAPEVRPGGKRVLFMPWYSRELLFLRETFLAKGCEFRGATTAMLYCDVFIGPTENGELAPRYGIRNPQLNGGEEALKHLKQRQLKASDYYVPINRKTAQDKFFSFSSAEIEAYEYRGIKLGELVVASAIRTTLGLGPEWESEAFRSFAVRLLITSIEMVDLSFRAFEDFKPDEVVMTHGVYVTWGAAYRVAKLLGIKVSVYNGGYRKDTVRMYHDTPTVPFPEANWPEYQDIALSPKERAWAEKYFQSRLNLDDESFNIFEGAEDPESLSEFIGETKRSGKRLAALFTNMSWDSYAFSNHKVFLNMVEWVNQTIEFVRERPSLRLILKIHPAEDYFSVPEKYRLRNHLSPLPNNILLLSEKDKVKPDLFYKEIDFGLINISTVSIEMGLLNIPVLTSGANGHYEGKGFTLSPTSLEDYENKLDSLIDDPTCFTPDREKALRYLFYRFYRESIVFEPLKVEGSEVKEVVINSYEDLKEGRLPGFDVLVNGIMKGTPYLKEGM